MADPHDLNSEVKLLRRQNRRLKVALLLFVSVLGVSGPVVAIKQSKLAEEAHEQIERARVAEERALHMLEDAREQTESENNVEP